MAVLILLLGLLFLLAAGVPLTLAMALPSIVVIIIFELGSLNIIPSILYASLNSYPLLAVPFFITVGFLMTESRMAGYLIELASLLVGRRLRGSVGYTTVLASIFLGGISGSSTADTAALSTSLFPSLRQSGFRASFAAALVCVGGGIGLIIPPSIAMIIYGLVGSVSIGQLFFAGIIPGIITGLFLGGAIFIESRKLTHQDNLAGPTKFSNILMGLLGLGAPFMILGGIYLGFFTPTESAAAAGLYIVLTGKFVYRTLSIKKVWEVLKSASSLTAAIMLLTAAGALYAWVITRLRVTDEIMRLLSPLVDQPISLVLALNFITLIAGAFVEPIPLIYMTIPLFVPVLQQAGVDLVYFGVVYTINLAVAQVTPPVGANLFVGAGVLKMPLEEVVKGLPWLVLALIVGLIVAILIPELSLFLPKLLFR